MHTRYLAYFQFPKLELADPNKYLSLSHALRKSRAIALKKYKCGGTAFNSADFDQTVINNTLTSLKRPDYLYIHDLMEKLYKINPNPTPEESLFSIYLPLILSKLIPETSGIFLESGWTLYFKTLLMECGIGVGRIDNLCPQSRTWGSLKTEIWKWLLKEYGTVLAHEHLTNSFKIIRSTFLMLGLRSFICVPNFLDGLRGELSKELYASWLNDQDYLNIEGFQEVRLGALNILVGLNGILFSPNSDPSLPKNKENEENAGLECRLYDDFLEIARDRSGFLKEIPRQLHVGVIMDGNRRWGRLYGLPGHFFGTQRAEELLRWFLVMPELSELTLYCLSADNLHKRSSEEIKFLEQLLDIYLQNLITQADVLVRRLQIKVIGEIDLLPMSLQKTVNTLHTIYGLASTELTGPQGTTGTTGTTGTAGSPGTAGPPGTTGPLGTMGTTPPPGTISAKKRLNLAIAYDPVEEIKRHFLTVDSQKNPNILENQIDWVIRCGNVSRTSGFFPLNTLYSEWVFLPQMWPEMTHEVFLETIKELSERERRFGA